MTKALSSSFLAKASCSCCWTKASASCCSVGSSDEISSTEASSALVTEATASVSSSTTSAQLSPTEPRGTTLLGHEPGSTSVGSSFGTASGSATIVFAPEGCPAPSTSHQSHIQHRSRSRGIDDIHFQPKQLTPSVTTKQHHAKQFLTTSKPMCEQWFLRKRCDRTNLRNVETRGQW